MAARNDPYKNFKFRVEISGITSAGFSECTGLSTEVDCIEYREGGDFVSRKLPGRVEVREHHAKTRSDKVLRIAGLAQKHSERRRRPQGWLRDSAR